MQDADGNKIVKIILILAVVFCIIAQILPWVGFDFERFRFPRKTPYTIKI